MNHPDYELAYFDDCSCANCEKHRQKERDASDLEIIKTFWDRIKLKGRKDFYPDYHKLIRAELKEMEEKVNEGTGSPGPEADPDEGRPGVGVHHRRIATDD